MSSPSLFDNPVPSAPQAMTLSAFASAVGESVRANRATQGVWIIAELSDVRSSGGHCYMELIEKDARGATVAKMRANIWAGTFYGIRARFEAATGRPIASGLKVMVRGSATYHNIYGFSVNITDIDPGYTLGDMERLRREILLRLQREGTLGLNRQLELDITPQRIAIISAPGAAGYGDLMKQLDGNSRGFRFYTHLFPAVMQGDRTSASVREALDMVEMTIDLWDCVVIVRGGGATTDLNGFDDYELALRVATFPLPVLVGIGHERDRTVLDEIANTRLKTPTAVGAFLVDRLDQAWNSAASLARRIADFASRRTSGDLQRLSHLQAVIPHAATARVADARLNLSRIANAIPAVSSGRISAALSYLDSIPRLMQSAVSARCRAEDYRLERMATAVSDTAASSLKDASARLDNLSALIGVLSPQATLARGYSITRINGKAIRSAADAAPGSEIETTLADGILKSILK